MEEAIDIVIEQGHSRIPVYEDTIDEIVGILYAKDLLPFLKPSVGERPSMYPPKAGPRPKPALHEKAETAM